MAHCDAFEEQQSRDVDQEHLDVLIELKDRCVSVHTSSLLVGDRVGVNVDTLDADGVFRSVLLVDLN